VVVLKDGFALHGKTIGDEDLQRQVAHIAAYSLQMSVLVSCADDSPHRLLMRVLDICASNGLTNIKVDNM
jgi:biopolymer transport protein ExbD